MRINYSRHGNSDELFKLSQPKNHEISPTLYIGLGGSGQAILLRLREKLFARHGKEYLSKLPIDFLYYDLDSYCAQYDDRRVYNTQEFKENIAFKKDETLLIRPNIKNVMGNFFLIEHPNISEWLSSQRIELIDTSFGAGQQRQIARLAFFCEYENISKALQNKLKSIELKQNEHSEGNRQKINIVFVFSIAGGTGSGSFLDMAFLCRYLSDVILLKSSVNLAAHIIMPDAFYNLSINKDSINANGYAALKELENFMVDGKYFETRWKYSDDLLKIKTPVFNDCYIISGNRFNSVPYKNVSEVFNMAADFLEYEINIQSRFSAIVNSVKSNTNIYLNSFTSSDLTQNEGIENKKKADEDLNHFTCKYSSYGIKIIDPEITSEKYTGSNNIDIFEQCNVSIKRYSGYLSGLQDSIVKEEANYFKLVIANKSNSLNFNLANRFKNNLIIDDDSNNSVILFNVIHGFPLLYCDVIQNELKASYDKMTKGSYDRPLHIFKDSKKFKDLIPCLHN